MFLESRPTRHSKCLVEEGRSKTFQTTLFAIRKTCSCSKPTNQDLSTRQVSRSQIAQAYNAGLVGLSENFSSLTTPNLQSPLQPYPHYLDYSRQPHLTRTTTIVPSVSSQTCLTTSQNHNFRHAAQTERISWSEAYPECESPYNYPIEEGQIQGQRAKRTSTAI